MQWIVVTAESEDKGLLGRGLILNDPVGLPVFWNGLCSGWAGNELAEVASSSLCSDVERRALREGRFTRAHVAEKART